MRKRLPNSLLNWPILMIAPAEGDPS